MNTRSEKYPIDFADFNVKVSIFYVLALILFTLFFIAWRLIQ